jgi:hypothetical protein
MGLFAITRSPCALDYTRGVILEKTPYAVKALRSVAGESPPDVKRALFRAPIISLEILVRITGIALG